MKQLRNRAWRRSQARVKSFSKKSNNLKQWCSEKNWKLMYTRSEKLRRARQLGIEYPKRTVRQVLDKELPMEDKV